MSIFRLIQKVKHLSGTQVAANKISVGLTAEKLKSFRSSKTMKRIIFVVLLALAVVLPVVAQDAPAPKTDAPVADAPKTDAPVADAPKADAPKAEKVEGKILAEKDVTKLKTADAELVLLACDKLTELLKVEKVAEKTFVLEGEKVAGKDGKEGFMIKSFEEKKEEAKKEEEKK